MEGTTYHALSANRWRTAWLLFLFPAMLATITLLGSAAASFAATPDPNEAIVATGTLFFNTIPFVTVGATVWMLIAILAGKRMILAFAGSKPITKAQEPELYRTVENLAIQTGIPTPQMYVIEDQSLNAFATGYRPQGAAVAVTRGLLTRLEKPELEAVMAHEMGHILHRDTRVMLIATTMVGIIQLISELILRSIFHGHLRSSSDRERGSGAIVIVLIAMVVIWLIGFLGAIFVQMGISRRREFMADARSAHLTRHPESLIRALEKISQDPRVEVLDGKRSVAAMCIIDPLERKQSFFDAIDGLFASHPPMKARVAALRSMIGVG